MAAVAGPVPFEPGTGVMPAFNGVEITPSATNLASIVRALYIGVAGNVVILTPASASLTFINVQAGSILPVMALAVAATASGTTAGNIIGLF